MPPKPKIYLNKRYHDEKACFPAACPSAFDRALRLRCPSVEEPIQGEWTYTTNVPSDPVLTIRFTRGEKEKSGTVIKTITQLNGEPDTFEGRYTIDKNNYVVVTFDDGSTEAFRADISANGKSFSLYCLDETLTYQKVTAKE